MKASEARTLALAARPQIDDKIYKKIMEAIEIAAKSGRFGLEMNDQYFNDNIKTRLESYGYYIKIKDSEESRGMPYNAYVWISW